MTPEFAAILREIRPAPAITVTPQRPSIWLFNLLIAFIACVICYFFWLVNVPVLVLYTRTNPLPILTPTVRAGDAVHFSLDYCKFVDGSAEVIREVWSVDRTVHVSLASSGSNLDVNCHRIEGIEPIPDYVPDGRWVLQMTRRYTRGTYHDWPRVLVTEPFTVHR